MRSDNNMDVKYMEFGLRVREARKSRGLTLRELAERINIGENFMARIESNNGRAGLGTIIKICNELKISMDFLFQDSLSQTDMETIDLRSLSKPDKKFIIKIVKNLREYRNDLRGSI